jgi:uncharacterized protein involved in exopolysaccharide biosynthesis
VSLARRVRLIALRPALIIYGFVPDVPAVSDEVAGLRAANARLRQMIEAKGTEIAALRTGYQAQLDALRAQVAVLTAEVADLRARLGQNPRNSSKPPSF